MSDIKIKNIIGIITLIILFVLLMIVGGLYWAYHSGYYHAMRGGIVEATDRSKAIEFYKIAYSKNNNAFMVAHDIASNYSVLNNKKEAFEWLSKTLKTSYADYARDWAKTEVDFNNIKEEPEFKLFLDGKLDQEEKNRPTQ